MPKQAESWSVTKEIRAEQKASLKKMPFKAKLEYFWEYYKLHTIITITVIALICGTIYTIATNKSYSFYAVMLNSYNLSADQIAADFNVFANLDSDRYLCLIETDARLNLEDYRSPYEMAISQRIMATVMAAELDVIVADGFTFSVYADGEFFIDLRFVLSESELAHYHDYLFYIDQAIIDAKKTDLSLDFAEPKTPEQKALEIEVRRHPEDMGDPIPVGIFVEKAPFILQNGAYSDEEVPVFGIISASRRHETAVMYLDFLWQ